MRGDVRLDDHDTSTTADHLQLMSSIESQLEG